ncbi:CAAX protease self-immunity [uncultured archaeon]|nr:CAAX protease self-immunity [uncultured archaeon]
MRETGNGAHTLLSGLLSAVFFSSSLFFVLALSLQLLAYGFYGQVALGLVSFASLAFLGLVSLRESFWVAAVSVALVGVFFPLSIASPYFPSVILSLLLLAIPFAWLKYVSGKGFSDSLSLLGFSRGNWVYYAALGVLAAIFIFYPLIVAEVLVLRFGLGIADLENVSNVLLTAPWWLSAFAVLVAPVGEEVFFRGFLVPRAGIALAFISPVGKRFLSRRGVSLAFGIAISTLLFMFAHYAYGSVAELAGALTIGFCLAILYLRTGSIASVMAAHAAFNLVSVALTYLGSTLPSGFMGL